MLKNHSRISLLSLALCIWMWSCTTPSTLERFRALDGDLKSTFISYYPYLNASQRDTFLDDPNSYLTSFSHWKIPKLDDTDLKNKNKLVQLLIEPKGEVDITQGTQIPLHAYAVYNDQKKIDVTADVRWEALPELAKIEDSTLRYRCVYSDVVITANFFDEKETSEKFTFRKKVNRLQVRVAESSAIVEKNEYVKLKLTAHCNDGTATDVSCQAIWKIDPNEGNFLGCGNLHPTPESFQDGAVTVLVSYGPIQISQKVHLPRRPKSNPSR